MFDKCMIDSNIAQMYFYEYIYIEYKPSIVSVLCPLYILNSSLNERKPSIKNVRIYKTTYNEYEKLCDISF